MKKKWLSALMAFVITASFGITSVHADVASDKAKIQQVQDQRKALENKVEIMDNQIETIMYKINDNKNGITKKRKDITQAQAEIATEEAALKKEQDLFNRRVRAIYISGPTSYIDVILDAKGIDQFIELMENCQKIISYDQKLINDYKTKKAACDLKKAALVTDKAKLLSLKADNEKKLADLTKQKSDQAVLIAKLNDQEKKYSLQLAAEQGLTYSRGGLSLSSNVVIAYASHFLGVPYVWGGTTPSGFDCSGFTQYVFAHFGIGLPRIAEAQQNVGTLVSRANLQPGDLVFFGNPAHHVGIYVGNGNMINAPHTGDVVKVQPLNSDFTYGRRVN